MRQSRGPTGLAQGREVAVAYGGFFERDDAATREDGVEDGFGEIGVLQDAAPALERLVDGKDHGTPAAVTLVDDIEKDVGGAGAVGKVSDLVNDEKPRAISATRSWAGILSETASRGTQCGNPHARYCEGGGSATPPSTRLSA